MSETTRTRGDNTAGNSECPTPIPSQPATPIGASGSQSSSRTRQFLTKAEKKIDKSANAFKRLVGLKEKGGAGGQEAGSGGGGTADAAAASAGLGTATPRSETGQELGATGFLVLGVAQEAIEDSPAAPPSTPGQLEDSVPLVTGEATESLTTTTTVSPTPGTPGLVGEEMGSDSIQGPTVSSPTPIGQAGEGAVVSSPLSASSKKTWAIVAGALKKTLSGAIPFIPDPFKGPAQVLLQIFNIFEKAKSNREEMENLKLRCNLLNESLAHAFERRQDRGSDELGESIGRLVKGIHDTLTELMANKSTGISAYVLVEDNAEALKEANQKIDQVLQCFWLENLIAGALVLSDVRQTVKDQEGWLAKFSVSVYRHFKNAALDKLKHVPGAAYDSQDLAKVDVCFEGTRTKLLAGIGRWMSDTAGKPIYVLDGIAGIGKSTVAKTVAQRAAAINSLGVSFFFSRDHADRQQASGFVHTIAYQLACCDPSYGKAIATAIDDAPESLHKIMAQQFSTFVADPLYAMLKKRTTPLIFCLS
ncbi:hypothetical protein H1R20_g4936, partial [Candolleomyces eurysporus]